MNLVTFRKNGQPVTTPVWFALENETLYVFTGMAAGKIKRIRNNNMVQVGPSSARGKPLGPMVNGQARMIYGGDAQHADALITQKYGWQKRFFSLINRFRKNIGDAAYLEISLSNEPPQQAAKGAT